MKRASIIRILLIACCMASLASGASCSIQPGKADNRAAGNDAFTFIYTKDDSEAAEDIKQALGKYCPQVRDHLQYSKPTSFIVEIFPDQKSYDASLTDKSVAGSPACSGYGKISLVSPRVPIQIKGIPYEVRLGMAIHEYTHLLVNEINMEAPIWLNEGIACYEGAEGSYVEKGSGILALLPPIPFEKIEKTYYETAAADVYSFLAVSFIIDQFGYNKLNLLLRNPGDFETIFSLTKSTFNEDWNAYIFKYKDQ